MTTFSNKLTSTETTAELLAHFVTLAESNLDDVFATEMWKGRAAGETPAGWVRCTVSRGLNGRLRTTWQLDHRTIAKAKLVEVLDCAQEMAAERADRCECADNHCPVHPGESRCTNSAVVTLFRIDMVDDTGTRFCADCADDAAESGLFSDCADDADDYAERVELEPLSQSDAASDIERHEARTVGTYTVWKWEERTAERNRFQAERAAEYLRQAGLPAQVVTDGTAACLVVPETHSSGARATFFRYLNKPKATQATPSQPQQANAGPSADTGNLGQHAELFELVAELLETHDIDPLAHFIAEAHRGNLRGPITNENLHLFRRYRNTVSPSPYQLIKDARATSLDSVAEHLGNMDSPERARAIADFLAVHDLTLVDETVTSEEYVLDGEAWMVLTDAEADERWEESLDSYIDECIIPELPESLQGYFDYESWKRDARMDGRGHCLGGYDGDEVDVTDPVTGQTFVAYRVN